MRAKPREVKDQLKRRRHESIPVIGQWLRSVVQGHYAYYAYYAVPGNAFPRFDDMARWGDGGHHAVGARRVDWWGLVGEQLDRPDLRGERRFMDSPRPTSWTTTLTRWRCGT
jgi:hypothetical protein